MELHALAQCLKRHRLRFLHVAKVAFAQLLLGCGIDGFIVLDHEGETFMRSLCLGQLLHVRHAGSFALATRRSGNGGGTGGNGRMENGLCQTDSQIVAGHLILLRVGGNNGQEF